MTRSRVAFVAVLALLLVAVPAVADAKFARTSSASTAVKADTLAPPTNVRVRCNYSPVGLTISWTPTADTYATGYTITGRYGGSQLDQDITGRTTTSYTYNGSVPDGSTLTMVSTYRNWSSASTTPITINC
jgi:hypothetical protein